jgi:hypothetical protein
VLPSFMSEGFDVARPRGHSLSELEIRPAFFGGVLARWFSVYPESYMPLQMSVVRLTSSNKGTDIERWNIVEPILDVQGTWMEPKYDLLVLPVYTENKRKGKFKFSP